MTQIKSSDTTSSGLIAVFSIVFGTYMLLGLVLWTLSTSQDYTTPVRTEGIHYGTGEQYLEEPES